MDAAMKDYLCSDDLIALLTLSHRSLECHDSEAFKKLILNLKGLIGFDYAVCASAKMPDVFLDADARLDYLNISYPKEYLNQYFKRKLFLTDYTVCSFVYTLEPIHWNTLHKDFWRQCASGAMVFDFGMRDGWTYGVVDISTMEGTQFTISSTIVESNPLRSRLILEYTIPYLAKAYQRMLGSLRKCPARLTPREIEVLQWLKEGKSSWEISKILNCSSRVIDFHANNIKAKLQCVNRVQAVAAALHYGIIDF